MKKPIKLSREEILMLREELANTKKGRYKQIKYTPHIISLSFILSIICWFYTPLNGFMFAVSSFAFPFSILYDIYWRYLVRLKLQKFEEDITKGVKIVGQSPIKCKNHFNKKWVLEDGSRFNEFELMEKKLRKGKGDLIYYEHTAQKAFVMQAKRIAK